MSALHLAVALDGAGWHPAAWREPDARPRELLTAAYWADQVVEAERGLLDFVTIEDSLGPQADRLAAPTERTDRVLGRLDAVLVAARIAPLTTHIGLIPTATVTHTEPFHISKAIATLDYVSSGRAGWRAQISGRANEAAHFGRRDIPAFTLADRDEPPVRALIGDLFDEAADYVEVVRRLWDSWEDDAEIRDADTGRFVDREKLHYIDFEGRWFNVRGPSITPRPPQGQPLVTALVHNDIPYRFAARSADLVYITPHDAADAAGIIGELRAAEAGVRRDQPLHIFADLVVFLGADAAARKARLDEQDGAEYESDALIFTGTATELADLLQEWQRAGLSGFRLRPGTIPHDLQAIGRELVPELQRRGAFRTSYDEGSLRERFGLLRPANRYVA